MLTNRLTGTTEATATTATNTEILRPARPSRPATQPDAPRGQPSGHPDPPAQRRGLSGKRCKWPNTLSCGLAGKGRYDRNTGGRESTITNRSDGSAVSGGAGRGQGAGPPDPR